MFTMLKLFKHTRQIQVLQKALLQTTRSQSKELKVVNQGAMGVGQRLVRGAAHVGGVVVVDQGDRIRDVLLPVYDALG